MFRAAAHEAPPDALLDEIEKLLGLAGANALRYIDRKHGQQRTARSVRSGADATLDGFLLAGDTRAKAWIATLLRE